MTKTKNSSKLLKEDVWLSDVLSKRTAVLQVGEAELGELKTALNQFCKANKKENLFIYAKVDTRKDDQVHFLEDAGFKLVDTWVQFELNGQREPMPLAPFEIRFATAEDAASAVEVARKNFVYSRFHRDPQISNDLANKVKADWVQNYFNGKRGDQMVVALKDDEIVGFLQILFQDDDGWIIDQVAVDASVQGQGVGISMIQFALEENQSREVVTVGTQVANIRSIRMYEKLGFRLIRSQYVFHYHQGETKK